jgi:hypothetical protein
MSGRDAGKPIGTIGGKEEGTMSGRKIWRMGVVAFVIVQLVRVVVGRNAGVEDTAPAVPEPGQTLVLQADGVEIPFAMGQLHVYLVDDDKFPESFEFEGDGVKLVGKIPLDLRIGYGEDWDRLVGHPIPFSRSSDEMETVSEIRMPGEAVYPVTEGAFTIQDVGDSRDGKTAVTGEIWLRCAAPEGERVFRGTFKVMGATWG